MNLAFTTRHGKSKEQRERVRAALDLGQANDAARTTPDTAPAAPAAPGTRSELRDRLGVTDPDASDEQILATLDALTATKAKPVTPAASKAKRVQPDAAEAAYDKAWGSTAKAAQPTVTADDALYALAWGNDQKGA